MTLYAVIPIYQYESHTSPVAIFSTNKAAQLLIDSYEAPDDFMIAEYELDKVEE